MVGIYKIQNQVNGKCYIGQSTNIQKRWTAHKNRWCKPSDHNYESPLYRTIRKYGIENFTFEVLEECSPDELNQKEIAYIQYYDSFWNGYNQSPGGENGGQAKRPKMHLQGIIDDLENTTLKHSEIAEKWGVSTEMVQGINTGRHWRHNRTYPIRPSKRNPMAHCPICNAPLYNHNQYCAICETLLQNTPTQPIAQTMRELIAAYRNFAAVASSLHTSKKTLRAWCERMNLPCSISSYIPRNIPAGPKCTGHHVRPVHMLDKETNIILQTFTSTKEAEVHCAGKSTGHITHVLKSTNPIAYGYKWAYADENT